MITGTLNIEVETSFKPEESTKFKVSTEHAHMLAEHLRDTLYSDVPASIVREILSNSLDANKEAKTTKKAQIEFVEANTLNGEQARFIFRDFGNGMSDEFIRNRYVCYLDSTKKDNNDSIGGYGIGCKSLFAYGGQYEIITKSKEEATARHYVAYIDKDNVGTINMLDSITLAEGIEGSTEIILPIKSDYDIKKFNTAIRDYCSLISEKVELVNVDIELNENFRTCNLLYETNDFRIYKRYSPLNFSRDYLTNDIYIMLGDVSYELSLTDYADVKKYLDSQHRVNNFCRNPLIIFKFAIGELTVSLSRESIRNNKANTDAIIAKISNAYIHMGHLHNTVMYRISTDRSFVKKNMLSYYKKNSKENHETLDSLFIRNGANFLDNVTSDVEKLSIIIARLNRSIEAATVNLYNKAAGMKAITLYEYDINTRGRQYYSINKTRTYNPYVNEVTQFRVANVTQNRASTTNDLYEKLKYDDVLGYVFGINIQRSRMTSIVLIDHTPTDSEAANMFKVLYAINRNTRNIVFINTTGLRKESIIMRYFSMTYNADYLLSRYAVGDDYVLSKDEIDKADKEARKEKARYYSKSIRVKKAVGTISIGVPNFHRDRSDDIGNVTYTPTTVNVADLLKHERIIYGSVADVKKLDKIACIFNQLLLYVNVDAPKHGSTGGILDQYKFLLIKANAEVQHLAKNSNNFIHVDDILSKPSYLSEFYGNYISINTTNFMDTLSKYLTCIIRGLNECDDVFNVCYHNIINTYETIMKNNARGYSQSGPFDDKDMPVPSDEFSKLLVYCHNILNKFAFLQTYQNSRQEGYGNHQGCHIKNKQEFSQFIKHYIKNEVLHS